MWNYEKRLQYPVNITTPNTKIIRKQEIKMKRVLLSTLAGAFIGYLYYRFIGCYSGTCAITSSPYISTFYFSLMGLLLGFIIKKEARKA